MSDVAPAPPCTQEPLSSRETLGVLIRDPLFSGEQGARSLSVVRTGHGPGWLFVSGQARVGVEPEMAGNKSEAGRWPCPQGAAWARVRSIDKMGGQRPLGRDSAPSRGSRGSGPGPGEGALTCSPAGAWGRSPGTRPP